MSIMIDVQSLPDYRQIEVDKVGIKDIRYPITVLDRTKGTQKTVASINMYVGLPHRFKGTHMSRFVEILNEYQGELISFKSMKAVSYTHLTLPTN